MQEVTLLWNFRASASLSLASDELVTLADVRLLTRLTLLAYNGVILVHLLSSFVLLLVWVRWREDASVCSSLDSW